MALIVTGDYTTPYGTTVPSVYWRWCGLNIDVTTASANVTLYGYVDAQAYQDRKTPIGTKPVMLTGDSFAALALQIESPNDGLSSVIYSHVKTLAGFEGATDA